MIEDDDRWGPDEGDWDSWEGELEPDELYTPTRALHAVFEDGPADRPGLIIGTSSTWPTAHMWQAKNGSGYITVYLYEHVGGGRYRVARESPIEGPEFEAVARHGHALIEQAMRERSAE